MPSKTTVPVPSPVGSPVDDHAPSVRTTPAPVKRYLDHLFVECGLAGNTVSAYQSDLLSFWDTLELRDVVLRDVTMQDVQAHLIELQERGLSISSIARHASAIRMFVRYLFAEREIHRDVATLLESPRRWTWNKLPRVLHYEQVEELLAAPAPKEEFYLRDRAILELLYATGMRVSELAHLTIEAVNLKIGYLRCLGKGNKERIIPVGNAAREALAEYLDIQRPQLVRSDAVRLLFLSRNGRLLDRSNIWRLVRKYATRAGVGSQASPVSPHTLRHCFATHLLAGGADLRIVQELLGHTDVGTTQIYTHVDEAHLKMVHSRYHPRP